MEAVWKGPLKAMAPETVRLMQAALETRDCLRSLAAQIDLSTIAHPAARLGMPLREVTAYESTTSSDAYGERTASRPTKPKSDSNSPATAAATSS